MRHHSRTLPTADRRCGAAVRGRSRIAFYVAHTIPCGARELTMVQSLDKKTTIFRQDRQPSSESTICQTRHRFEARPLSEHQAVDHSPPAFSTLALKAIVVHTVTYFVCGVVAFYSL